MHELTKNPHNLQIFIVFVLGPHLVMFRGYSELCIQEMFLSGAWGTRKCFCLVLGGSHSMLGSDPDRPSARQAPYPLISPALSFKMLDWSYLVDTLQLFLYSICFDSQLQDCSLIPLKKKFNDC